MLIEATTTAQMREQLNKRMDNSDHHQPCACGDCRDHRREAALNAAKEQPKARRSTAACSPFSDTPETDEMGSMRRTVTEWRNLCEKLERERNEWKANHDNQVALKRIIAARPDLKDRAPMVEKLMAERNRAQAHSIRQHAPIAALITAGIGVFGLMLEAMTVMPHYVDEPATVRKVVKEGTSWGYIGTDLVTLARFDDGMHAECGGDRGEPGELVLMPRQRGTTSMLGILGDRRK